MTVRTRIDGHWRDGSAGGEGLFETIGAIDGELPLWPRHAARLWSSLARLGWPEETPGDLHTAAIELLQSDGRPDGILRVAAVRRADSVAWELSTRAREPRDSITVCLVDDPRNLDVSHDLKRTPRDVYDGARAQALAAGADEALLVAPDGSVSEGAVTNLFVQLGDELVTPPLDGRVLPGVARQLLMDELAARGTPVSERRVQRRDLESAAGIWVTNAVYGPRTAALIPRPAPSGNPLADAWRDILSRFADRAGGD